MAVSRRATSSHECAVSRDQRIFFSLVVDTCRSILKRMLTNRMQVFKFPTKLLVSNLSTLSEQGVMQGRWELIWVAYSLSGVLLLCPGLKETTKSYKIFDFLLRSYLICENYENFGCDEICKFSYLFSKLCKFRQHQNI